MNYFKQHSFLLLHILLLVACGNHSSPSKEMVDQLQLKRGNIVACGPPEKEFGLVNFDIAGSKQVKEDFNTAVALLHSFEYDEAEKMFAKVIDESPNCAMAYWGVAMCNFHPLWDPPTPASLAKGSKAIEIANSIEKRSAKETAYINAVAAYYNNWRTNDARSRSAHFEDAMAQLRQTYPEDREAAIFYALALDASADPADKTYAHQRKAGKILDSIYALAPNHPGIVHYIIHTYDYPGIAYLALPAARRYAEVAPSSAHALHMPSHIFTRLGLWDESIQLNKRSMDAARCYAAATGIKGHWDEELHGLDYLVYACLQKGNDSAAAAQVRYLATMNDVFPVNFKEAYTFAASPCRAALESRNWIDASRLTLQPATFPWKDYPWQEAIIHFGKLLGLAHTGNIAAAEKELSKLDTLQAVLVKQNEAYKAKQVRIQWMAGKAWIAYKKGADKDALYCAKAAADAEDSISKSPVTPGEVLPSRELYGDMLLAMHQNKEAFLQYDSVLKKCPNRFNSLFGAARSAELTGDTANANRYYKALLAIADPRSARPELTTANALLNKK